MRNCNSIFTHFFRGKIGNPSFQNPKSKKFLGTFSREIAACQARTRLQNSSLSHAASYLSLFCFLFSQFQHLRLSSANKSAVAVLFSALAVKTSVVTGNPFQFSFDMEKIKGFISLFPFQEEGNGKNASVANHLGLARFLLLGRFDSASISKQR